MKTMALGEILTDEQIERVLDIITQNSGSSKNTSASSRPSWNKKESFLTSWLTWSNT